MIRDSRKVRALINAAVVSGVSTGLLSSCHFYLLSVEKKQR